MLEQASINLRSLNVNKLKAEYQYKVILKYVQ